MAVVSFASLKGGVGKTSCAVNVARALSKRSCEVIFIDLDPTAQATRFYHLSKGEALSPSPLAQLLLSERLEPALRKKLSLLRASASLGIKFLREIREGVHLLSADQSLEKLASVDREPLVTTLFPKLVEELETEFDFVVIDTPPQFSTLTKAALSASSAVVIPIDMSVMSIWAMEELIERAAGIHKPHFAILRNLVSRSASRIQSLSDSRLKEQLPISGLGPSRQVTEEEDLTDFVDFVAEAERAEARPVTSHPSKRQDDKPLYLLDTVIYRTELHNRLSFCGKTAFDLADAKHLAEQYEALAKEVEELVACSEEEDFSLAGDEFTAISSG